MGMMRAIRLLSMLSILLSLWQFLYLKMKHQNQRNLIEKGSTGTVMTIPSALQDFQHYFRGRRGNKRNGVKHSHREMTPSSANDQPEAQKVNNKDDDSTALSSTGNGLQTTFANLPEGKRLLEGSQGNTDLHRDKLKLEVRKRRRVRERVEKKPNDAIIPTSIDRKTRIMEKQHLNEASNQRTRKFSPQQEGWNGKEQGRQRSWFSNALPEFKDGESLMLQKEPRMKGITQSVGLAGVSTNPQRRRRSIVFVHVGKASGRTIQQTFKAGCYAFRGQRRRRACLTRLTRINQSSTMLSQSVKTRIHCDRIGPIKDLDSTTTFLWSTRDPVDRIVSWYDSTNPANCQKKEAIAQNCQIDRYYREGWVHDFFKICFATATSFIHSLRDPDWRSDVETTTGIRCNKLAWMGILGFAPPDQSTHLHYNYAFYKNSTYSNYPGKETMVVRTEYLWEDLTSVERYLGGSTVFDSKRYDIDVTHGSHAYKLKASLNRDSQQVLCCAIQDEISIYVDLIKRAVNLNASAQETSLKSLAARCNVTHLRMLKKTCNDRYRRMLSSRTEIENTVGHDEREEAK